MVFAASMLVSGPPPTSAALTPPLPFSPWHMAHFCAKTRAPCVGVPPPDGNPAPSGKMLMSQAAISAGLTGFPRFGPSAKAMPAPSARITAELRSLCVNMLHLPLAVDRPAGDAVVVLTREGGYRWDRLGL